MFGVVEFGVIVKELCPSVGLTSVAVVIIDHRGGGGMVQGDSVRLFVVDLEVEVASSDGDGPCGGVVVGELSVFVEGGNDSVVGFGGEFVHVQIAYIHNSYLKLLNKRGSASSDVLDQSWFFDQLFKNDALEEKN